MSFFKVLSPKGYEERPAHENARGVHHVMGSVVESAEDLETKFPNCFVAVPGPEAADPPVAPQVEHPSARHARYLRELGQKRHAERAERLRVGKT